MSEFHWKPDNGATIEEDLRVRATQFGDGYEQTAPDGLNPIAVKFSLSFTRSPDIVAQILAFLRSKSGGQTFTFTPPGGSEIRVKCRRWRTTLANTYEHRLTADMEKVYE